MLSCFQSSICEQLDLGTLSRVLVTYLIGVYRDICDRVKIENGCCVGVKREGEEGREGG